MICVTLTFVFTTTRERKFCPNLSLWNIIWPEEIAMDSDESFSGVESSDSDEEVCNWIQFSQSNHGTRLGLERKPTLPFCSCDLNSTNLLLFICFLPEYVLTNRNIFVCYSVTRGICCWKVETRLEPWITSIIKNYKQHGKSLVNSTFQYCISQCLTLTEVTE